MNNKVLAGILVVVIAVAAIGIGYHMMDKDEKVPEDAVILYDGNGGTYDGLSRIYASVSEVMDPGFKNAIMSSSIGPPMPMAPVTCIRHTTG